MARFTVFAIIFSVFFSSLSQAATPLMVLEGNVDGIRSVDISADKQYLATASHSETVLWNLQTQQPIKRIQNDATTTGIDTWDVDFSPLGDRFLATNLANLRMYDLAGNQLGSQWTGHTEAIRCSAFTPDGSKVLSTGHDNTIKVWNASDGSLIRTINTGETNWIISLDISPVQPHVAIGGEFITKIFNYETGQLLSSWASANERVVEVEYSPDGSKLAIGGTSESIVVRETQSGNSLFSSDMEGVTNRIVFKNDGSSFFAVSRLKFINEYDAQTGSLIQSIEHPENAVSIAISDDDQWLAVGDEAGKTTVYDISIENINTVANFPDPNFSAAVEEFMGVEPGGVFTAEQAASKTGTLNASNKNIVSVDGLSFFTSLTGLTLRENQIGNIDLEALVQLQTLDLQFNQIQRISLENNKNLITANIANNQLRGASLGALPNLKDLNLSDNSLSGYDISALPQLEAFHLVGNQRTISSLSFRNNPNLSYLSIESSGVSTLDLVSNPKIAHLRLQNNNLRTLSLPLATPNLTSVDLRDNFFSCKSWYIIKKLIDQIGEAEEFHDWGLNPPVSGIAFNQQKNGVIADCGDPIESFNQSYPTPDVVYNPQNGHYYTIIDTPEFWTDAKILAESIGGYLGTITSKEESDFLVRSFEWEKLGYSFLGGYQDPTVEEIGHNNAAEGWNWVTGEEWDYTNWDWDNERPNNLSGDEDFLHFVEYYPGEALWDDCPNHQIHSIFYALIEWDQSPPINHNLVQIDVRVAYWPENGHYYGVVDFPQQWEDANQLVLAHYDNAYLATVTSEQENNFLLNTFGTSLHDRYLGGYQNPDFSEEVEDDFSRSWNWITGEEWVYSYWGPGEPNNLESGNEDYLQYREFQNVGVYWNDTVPTRSTGFVVEWESLPESTGLFNIIFENDSVDNINNVANFPDPNFRAAVEEFMGVEPGGGFTAEEAASKTGSLVVSNLNIQSLSGIQFFRYLESLDCSNNNIAEIDLSLNSALTTLECNYNKLRELNLSNNPKLTWVSCVSNEILSLNLSKNFRLGGINASQIPIEHIDFSNNVRLNYLGLSGTNISELDLSNNANLQVLHMRDNMRLESLDLTNNIKLRELSCRFNGINDIFFPDSPDLIAVDIRNNFLDYSHWAVIKNLKLQLGEPTFRDSYFIDKGFAYSPQQHHDPFDGDININSSEFFTDENMLESIQNFMGVDDTGVITVAEAYLKEGVLDVSDRAISRLNGIEYFTNLDGFIANDCNLRMLSSLVEMNFSKESVLIDVRNNAIGRSQFRNIITLILRHGEENFLYNPQNYTLQADVQVKYWPENGHFYGVAPNSLQWDEANEFVLTHFDDAYLATITSQEENDFIVQNLEWERLSFSWLGGFQPETHIENDNPATWSSGWVWVTGEEWNYTNWWTPQQPDDANRLEDYLQFTPFELGKWNDQEIDNFPSIKGFVVEWETLPESTGLFNIIIDPADIPVLPELGGDELSAGPTQEILVPLSAKSLDPLSAFSIEAVFDENVLEWTGELVTDNSMIADWSFADANLVGDNRLILAALGTDTIEGDGSLLYLKFVVKENTQISTNTSITFENPDGFGDVLLHPVTIEIGGMLGDLNDDGRISISDVQVLFDIVLRRIEPTASQQVSGDLNKDGRISITDVQALFDVVLQRAPLPAQVFEPLTKPQQVSQITIPESSAQVGDSLIVPINLSSSEMMSAFEMTVNYDPALLNFVGMDTESTLTDSFSFIDANQTSSGVIIAAGLSTEEIQANGTLFFLEFEILSGAGGETQLELTNLDGDLFGWTIQSGTITLDASTMIRDYMRY